MYFYLFYYTRYDKRCANIKGIEIYSEHAFDTPVEERIVNDEEQGNESDSEGNEDSTEYNNDDNDHYSAHTVENVSDEELVEVRKKVAMYKSNESTVEHISE